MKNVDVEFINIQSHEHTMFRIQPGLNFILADDNNVGKSTIFKVLMTAMQMPHVKPAEYDELVRGGCTQARATFKFDNVCCHFWMFRSSNRATIGFFETNYGDGNMIRSDAAPDLLREALDIVNSDDHKVVNFNDADSVQLIVEDTPKNDEVLSKILIDLRVDDIKLNMMQLGREIQQDFRVVQSKLDDATHTLDTMHYVDSVDTFNEEKQLLTAACSVADDICEPCLQLEDIKIRYDGEELKRMRTALRVLDPLQSLEFPEVKAAEGISEDFISHIRLCLGVVEKLDEASSQDYRDIPELSTQKIDNAKRAITVLDVLTRVSGAVVVSDSAAREMRNLSAEKVKILKELERIAPRVHCPVRGEVFYSDEKCVPYSD